MIDKSPRLIDGRYSFTELVDIVRLREMFEAFSTATGFSAGISTYPDQEPLIRTGWQDICTRFHRAVPASNEQCIQSNLELTAPLEEQRSINVRRCRCGLIDGATPVIIRGVHVADILTGQVLFEKPDIECFRKQAEEYGYDEADYLEALAKVPVTEEESFRKMLRFLNEIAVLLAEQGLAEVMSRSEAERATTGEENVRAILDSIGDGVIATDASGLITRLNPVAEELTGWDLDEAKGRPLQEVFHIVNTISGEPAENPADKVLKEGTVVGLANHTALIARDGRRFQIADSAAPILGTDRSIRGVVLVFRNVTEEYRILAALKESEETFRSIIESSPMGMFIYQLEEDDRLIFSGSNPAADRILGVDTSAFMGMTIEEAFPPLAETEVPDRYRRAARLGESWMTEQISYDHGGISGAYQVHAFRMSPGRMAVMFFDITERKRAEERLRSERIFTDTVIQSLPGLFYIIEEDTARLIRWNTNWNLIAGYTDEEMRKASALDFVEDKELIASRMQRVYDYGSSSAETCLLTRDGRKIPYYFSGERVVIDDKTYLAGMGIDISERWKALESLRESEERFRDLVDLLPEAVFETDRDIRLTFANRRAYDLFGYSGEDIERGLAGLELIAPEDRERARSNIMRRLQGEKIGAIEYSAVKKDGSTCPVLLHTNVIIKEGQLHGLRGIIMDISESKAIMEEKARLEM
ncbi:MAG TPA: PAS domain S-box protein, partial [Candidatus Krumholzibacterium sp.]|nr:PAS domain S-box protein [Candidatus Krumholzibacterium sp.]